MLGGERRDCGRESEAGRRPQRERIQAVRADGAGEFSRMRDVVDGQPGRKAQAGRRIGAGRPYVKAYRRPGSDGHGPLFRTRAQVNTERGALLEQVPEQRAGEVVKVEPVGFLAVVHAAQCPIHGDEFAEPAVVLAVQVQRHCLGRQPAPGQIAAHPACAGVLQQWTYTEPKLPVAGQYLRHGAGGRAAPTLTGVRGLFAQLELQGHRGGPAGPRCRHHASETPGNGYLPRPRRNSEYAPPRGVSLGGSVWSSVWSSFGGSLAGSVIAGRRRFGHVPSSHSGEP